jgi:hypothetical protein
MSQKTDSLSTLVRLRLNQIFLLTRQPTRSEPGGESGAARENNEPHGGD